MDRNCLDAKAEKTQYVALRKESVDRNKIIKILRPNGPLSLSARRAWIEITVDSSSISSSKSRSPQGERG